MLYAKIGALVLILGTVYAGYFYITNLQKEVVALHKANTKYEIVVKDMKFNLENLTQDIELNNKRIVEFNAKIKANEEQVNGIRKTISKHNLNRIIQRKPKLFEKIAQKGTDKYYKDLEEASKWEK